MKKAEIYYFTLIDEMPRTEKLAWFKNTAFKKIEFDRITPDKANNWINQSDNDFESLIPVCDKEVKLNKSQASIFRLFSAPVKTNRDDWVYDISQEVLKNKIVELIAKYEKDLALYSGGKVDDFVDYSIKWSSGLKEKLMSGKNIKLFNKNFIRESLYRPFFKVFYYSDKSLSDRLTINHFEIWGNNLNLTNKVITFNYNCSIFSLISTEGLIEYGSLLVGGGSTQCLPLFTYDQDGNRHDNITDWALNQFNAYYAECKFKFALQKIDIFHYIYAVLHNPAYREKYEVNLKREFPRIPFYQDFQKWAEIGKQLMDLHLNYETVTPYLLQREAINALKNPKTKLKADKINGIIVLDENTQLSGIPASAWEYKLGNRSALEWVLDQHKEKKPKDKTIAEKFNNYRFADYKEQVIDLLSRVCTVSVETMQLIAVLKTLNE